MANPEMMRQILESPMMQVGEGGREREGGKKELNLLVICSNFICHLLDEQKIDFLIIIIILFVLRVLCQILMLYKVC